MKKLNHLMLIVAAATVGVSLSAQTCKPSAGAELADNAAVLSSPRYLEEHPELLRGGLSGKTTPAQEGRRLPVPAGNIALANSPRFREEHPGLLRAVSSAENPQVVSEADQLRKLTDNRALAASPRFREEHPELRIPVQVFEVGVLK